MDEDRRFEEAAALNAPGAEAASNAAPAAGPALRRGLAHALAAAFGGLPAAFSRFPAAAALCGLAALAMMAGSWGPVVSSSDAFAELMQKTAAASLLGALFAALGALFCELRVAQGRALSPARGRLASVWLPCLAAGAFLAALYLWQKSDYLLPALAGFAVLFVLLIVYLLFRMGGAEGPVPALVAGAVFAGAAAGVMLGGVELCLAALDALVLDLDWRFYETVIWPCIFFCAPMLLLARLPRAGEAQKPSRAYETLAGKIGLPLYLLLLAVLYLYFGKMLLTWSMPSGEINWYASFALLFFVFFALQARALEGALPRWFGRFGGFLLLPVVAVQLVAVGIRVSAYGITPARWCSIGCIAAGALFLLASLLPKKPFDKALLGAAAIAVLLSMTPLGAIDVANRSQTARLEAALRAEGMYDGEAITPNAAASAENIAVIRESAEFLRYSAGRHSGAAALVKDADALDALFGFPAYENGDRTAYCSYRGASGPIDISGFAAMEPFNWYWDEGKDALAAEAIEDGGKYGVFDDDAFGAQLPGFARALYEQQGENGDGLTMRIETEAGVYLLDSLSFSLDTDTGEFLWLEASGWRFTA